jgi:branched-chain amino acid transport system permease protein
VLVFGAALVAMMVFRPQGLIPSRRRAAEMETGSAAGGLGALGAEVAGETSAPTTSAPAPTAASRSGGGDG